MSGRKRRLTKAEKQAKKERRERYEWIFVGGKQKRVLREPTIEGLPLEEFLRPNADPICLQQEGLWELMEEYCDEGEGP